MYQFPLINDELVIGGSTVESLVGKVPGTPFYVYEKESIARRARELRQLFPSDVIRLHYALKANPNREVVEFLSGLLDGMDVASGGEMKLALGAGTPAEHISFAGPGKSDLELQSALAAGVTINVESVGELERIHRFGQLAGVQPRIALRVNPDFELKSSGMKMGGGSKPFGIDAESIPQVLARARELDISPRGFHIFSGSQNLNPDKIIEAQNATFELAYELARYMHTPLELLNIGGGFGIPYFPGELPLELDAVADNLQRNCNECTNRLGSMEIVLELGRYLVGEAGVYVCRVVDKKISRGKTYLVVDGGMHHHLAASGNFGQVIRKNFPVVTARNVYGGQRQTVSVVGPLCTPLDILADNLEMGIAERGDLICVLQSGAYGYSASPLNFLSHPLPGELII